jgi:hypothetical protein
MDLERMLEKCRRDQWSADDLDWSARPRGMSRDDEIAIVQLFTDMAGIELLAGELFAEQGRRATDPRLRKIFATFVADEKRHSDVAQRLADFYDVHHYKTYRRNEHLERFFPHFLAAIRYLSDEIATAYITAGELILDVALLRSINDYVADEMSEQAMRLINRDESRHIAVDYSMVAKFASPEHRALEASRPRPALAERVKAWWTFLNLLYHAGPFFRDVFFEPMDRVDRSGRRLREAFKRMQLLRTQPGVTETPFGRFLEVLQQIANHPVGGPLFGNVASRLAGVRPEFMRWLCSDDEMERARKMSIDQLVDEALSAKFASLGKQPRPRPHGERARPRGGGGTAVGAAPAPGLRARRRARRPWPSRGRRWPSWRRRAGRRCACTTSSRRGRRSRSPGGR